MIPKIPMNLDLSRRRLLRGSAAGALALIGWRAAAQSISPKSTTTKDTFEVTHTDAEWKQRLTPAQYKVLRHEGTELPYSSALNGEHRPGVFICAGCDLDLFSSTTKFDSGTGWPSFWQPLQQSVDEVVDSSFGMTRTEVRCHRCGGHLGHVFNDGPQPTGLRYCMNGVAMAFKAGAA